MRKISTALLAGAGVLFANSAMAADVFTNDATYLGMSQPNVSKCEWFAMTLAVATNPVDRDAWLSSKATTIRTTMLPASDTSKDAATITTSRAPALASVPRA